MFRPTHFAILFAVILFAYAAPAAPAAETPAKAAEINPTPKDAAPGVAGKGDLATDATSHFAYSYGYGPTVYTYPVGWAGRSIGFEFGKVIDPLHPLVYTAPLIL